MILPKEYFYDLNLSECGGDSIPTDKHLILNEYEYLPPICPSAPAVIYNEAHEPFDAEIRYLPIAKWINVGTIRAYNDVNIPIINAALVVEQSQGLDSIVGYVVRSVETIETVSGETNTYTLQIPENLETILKNGFPSDKDLFVYLAFITNGTRDNTGVSKNVSQGELCANGSATLTDDENVGIYYFSPILYDGNGDCRDITLSELIEEVKEFGGEGDFGGFVLHDLGQK